ncbi:hypothetical protein Tco_1303014 [Tanacetum coccineum]
MCTCSACKLHAPSSCFNFESTQCQYIAINRESLAFEFESSDVPHPFLPDDHLLLFSVVHREFYVDHPAFECFNFSIASHQFAARLEQLCTTWLEGSPDVYSFWDIFYIRVLCSQDSTAPWTSVGTEKQYFVALEVVVPAESFVAKTLSMPSPVMKVFASLRHHEKNVERKDALLLLVEARFCPTIEEFAR